MSRAKNRARAQAGMVFRDGKLIPRSEMKMNTLYPTLEFLEKNPEMITDGMLATGPGGRIVRIEKKVTEAPTIQPVGAVLTAEQLWGQRRPRQPVDCPDCGGTGYGPPTLGEPDGTPMGCPACRGLGEAKEDASTKIG